MLFYKKLLKSIPLVAVVVFLYQGNSQSIRKNYQEMTTYEKTELVNAFYQLREGEDRITDMSDFHMNYFNFDNIDPNRLDIHFNLPEEPEKEIFLAWHRRFIFEMEQAMQDINPKLTIPYWESSVDQSTTSSLWDEDFMGSFNSNWNLNRNLSSFGTLPTQQEVDNMLAMTDFFEFSDFFERQRPHSGAHRWVAGPMLTSASPRDPVFYLHHAFVDKLWHDWEEMHHSSSYVRTDMIRYDGTYVFDGQTIPLVNPNDIVDSRALGVFYAEDGLATLDNYIVSNTYNPEELFYYQYTIEVGNNFIAPENTTSKMESITEVVLKPGFFAESGANFVAAIDTETTSLLAARSMVKKERKKKPFDDVQLDQVWLWSEGDIDPNDPTVVMQTFPNPFDSKITIKLNKKRDCVIEIYNMTGQLIKQEFFEFTNTLEINNLFGLSSGTYFVKVLGGNGETLVVKKVIKI
ncbi:tyrosinase family protein [Galbibacter pacificus]|uniref:Tyrosinase family protein n=1 Tax=Galbibacter pacificus TaxID=2996052 RepID=A0ABT6FUS9_9FLAO|nr:tyrosinase family protein [Galbibacter pacificus]MDG3583495.1 tyrosinase family protein [Galbibacter pacificus]MDG3587028.1 tyrosinase family protein [Galbibacter pacificus]